MREEARGSGERSLGRKGRKRRCRQGLEATEVQKKKRKGENVK
jgi:hypothetical protein